MALQKTDFTDLKGLILDGAHFTLRLPNTFELNNNIEYGRTGILQSRVCFDRQTGAQGSVGFPLSQSWSLRGVVDATQASNVPAGYLWLASFGGTLPVSDLREGRILFSDANDAVGFNPVSLTDLSVGPLDVIWDYASASFSSAFFYPCYENLMNVRCFANPHVLQNDKSAYVMSANGMYYNEISAEGSQNEPSNFKRFNSRPPTISIAEAVLAVNPQIKGVPNDGWLANGYAVDIIAIGRKVLTDGSVIYTMPSPRITVINTEYVYSTVAIKVEDVSEMQSRGSDIDEIEIYRTKSYLAVGSARESAPNDLYLCSRLKGLSPIIFGYKFQSNSAWGCAGPGGGSVTYSDAPPTWAIASLPALGITDAFCIQSVLDYTCTGSGFVLIPVSIVGPTASSGLLKSCTGVGAFFRQVDGQVLYAYSTDYDAQGLVALQTQASTQTRKQYLALRVTDRAYTPSQLLFTRFEVHVMGTAGAGGAPQDSSFSISIGESDGVSGNNFYQCSELLLADSSISGNATLKSALYYQGIPLIAYPSCISKDSAFHRGFPVLANTFTAPIQSLNVVDNSTISLKYEQNPGYLPQTFVSVTADSKTIKPIKTFVNATTPKFRTDIYVPSCDWDLASTESYVTDVSDIATRLLPFGIVLTRPEIGCYSTANATNISSTSFSLTVDDVSKFVNTPSTVLVHVDNFSLAGTYATVDYTRATPYTTAHFSVWHDYSTKKIEVGAAQDKDLNRGVFSPFLAAFSYTSVTIAGKVVTFNGVNHGFPLIQDLVNLFLLDPAGGLKYRWLYVTDGTGFNSLPLYKSSWPVFSLIPEQGMIQDPIAVASFVYQAPVLATAYETAKYPVARTTIQFLGTIPYTQIDVTKDSLINLVKKWNLDSDFLGFDFLYLPENNSFRVDFVKQTFGTRRKGPYGADTSDEIRLASALGSVTPFSELKVNTTTTPTKLQDRNYYKKNGLIACGNNPLWQPELYSLAPFEVGDPDKAIARIFSQNGRLYVFKEDEGIYRVEGQTIGSNSISQTIGFTNSVLVDNSHYIRGENTLQALGDGLFFLSNKGIVFLDNNEVVQPVGIVIDSAIRAEIKRVQDTVAYGAEIVDRLAKISSFVNESTKQYGLAFPDGKCFVLDLKTGNWSTWNTTFDGMRVDNRARFNGYRNIGNTVTTLRSRTEPWEIQFDATNSVITSIVVGLNQFVQIAPLTSLYYRNIPGNISTGDGPWQFSTIYAYDNLGAVYPVEQWQPIGNNLRLDQWYDHTTKTLKDFTGITVTSVKCAPKSTLIGNRFYAQSTPSGWSRFTEFSFASMQNLNRVNISFANGWTTDFTQVAKIRLNKEVFRTYVPRESANGRWSQFKIEHDYPEEFSCISYSWVTRANDPTKDWKSTKNTEL